MPAQPPVDQAGAPEPGWESVEQPAKWLIIADDLTGGCDSAAAFAARGLRTRVELDLSMSAAAVNDAAAVTSLVTESRAMRSAEEAAQAARRAARGAAQTPVYHKIDSTLRGYPGAELAALAAMLAETGANRALVCPAFPEQGRVVRAGEVLVHGVPLAQRMPGGDSMALERLFDAGAGCRALRLEDVRRGADWLADRLAQPGVYTADAEEPGDLALLARAGLRAGIRLFCGSAGLARALAAETAPGAAADSEVCAAGWPRLRGSRPLLVVAGSRNPATLEQVSALAGQGCEVVYPLAEDMEECAASSPPVLCIATLLSGGRPAALSVARLEPADCAEERVAAWLADLVRAVMERSPSGGLALTGGATARAVLAALGGRAIELRGEVEPGIPWGVLRGGPWDGLPLLTKAGGFGDPGALARAVLAA